MRDVALCSLGRDPVFCNQATGIRRAKQTTRIPVKSSSSEALRVQG